MKVVSNNKKAFFDFFISDLLEAGIVLEGCEVKSVRAGGASLTDSFVVVKNGEMFLKNAYIKPYEKTSPHSGKDLSGSCQQFLENLLTICITGP